MINTDNRTSGIVVPKVSAHQAPTPAVSLPSSAATSENKPAADTEAASRQVAKLNDIAAKSEQSFNEAVREMDQQQGRVEEAIRLLNERLRASQKNLSFAVDEISNRVIISVVDQQSGEVVRQVPAESVLKFAHTMESLKGILFEEEL
jgi:flagellar protein FlaG